MSEELTMPGNQQAERAVGAKMPKLCHLCGIRADLAISFIVSSVGKSPRLQKTSRSVHFCNGCIQSSCDPLRVRPWEDFGRALREAYTQVMGVSPVASHPETPADAGARRMRRARLDWRGPRP